MDGRDIPIVKLIPLRERKVSDREYQRIAASIRAVGLLEPLVVFEEGDHYVILNGYVRYRILLDNGVELVPCIVRQDKEAFTSNRMVNRLSPIQEARMIRKSLKEIDEATISRALAFKGLSHRLKTSLLGQLHPRMAAAFDTGNITQGCARELTFVKTKRQEEILDLMENYKDYSLAFARTMILKTPPPLRNKKPKGKSPWENAEQKKNNLLQKLKESEERHDFYANVYRQYSINLLKLVIYVRMLITNKRVEECLQQRYPEMLARLREIIVNAEG